MHRLPIPPLVALLVASSVLPAPAQKPDAAGSDALKAALALEKTFESVIERSEKSVVSIARFRKEDVEKAANLRRQRRFLFPNQPAAGPSPDSPDFIPNSFGSGIIIAPLEKGRQRFILTNYHVVKGGPAVKPDKDAKKPQYGLYVRLANRRGFYASILAADPRADLAILKIDYEALKLKPEELTPLKLGSRDRFRKGQFVLALGNPYAQARDGSASASWGMISNISRKPKPLKDGRTPQGRKEETLHHLGTLLQVDTRLSLGFSGGALLNLKGELIGITTSMAALEGYETSVGYAIPFDAAVRRIIVTLAKGREVEYGFLGVQPYDVTPGSGRLPRRLKRQFGVWVKVVPDSPAERANVRTDDVVLEVDGEPVYDRYDLMRAVGELAPDSRARLRIWRGSDNRELLVSVRLGKWPVLNDEDIIASARRFPAWRGVTVDYPTGRFRYIPFPVPRYQRGVLVRDVSNPALSKSRALQPGDFITHVNNTPVLTPAQFHAAVRDLKGPVLLRLHTGTQIRVPE